MVTKLGRADIRVLVEALASDVPHSLQIHGFVKSVEDGALDADVFVDCWPVYTAVLVVPTHRPEVLASFTGQCALHRTREACETGVLSVLCREGVLDWTRGISIRALSQSAKDIFQTVASSRGNVETYLCSDLLVATKDTIAPVTPLQNLSSSVGVVESKLEHNDVDFVISKWKFGNSGNRDYISSLITHFPSVALRSAEDPSALIGWATVHFHGGIGAIYVEPGYRGRGLGKFLTLRISHVVIEVGLPLFVMVESHNENAKRMYEKCGFTLSSINSYGMIYEPTSYLS